MLFLAGCSTGERYVTDPAWLAVSRDRIEAGDARAAAAFEVLMREAEAAMAAGPWSVMDKPMSPPSGDRHDYLSLSTYHWPDPAQEDGLPWVFRDGRANPEGARYDRARLEAMSEAVWRLAWAYRLTGESRYAERAAAYVRVWFIDEATRMNPHLEYGQSVPGGRDGAFWGIIDTHDLVYVVDAVALIERSGHWREADDQALRAWFDQYVTWLLESDFGRRERRNDSNHGSWYDVQVVTFARYAGRADVARKTAEAAAERRIAKQIEPDGSQPRELRRTRSLTYSLFNLGALMTLADVCEPLGVDLWSYASEDGRSIRAAVEHLLPYVEGEADWPAKQITEVNWHRVAHVYRRAAMEYGGARYERAARRAIEAHFDEAWHVALLWPGDSRTSR